MAVSLARDTERLRHLMVRKKAVAIFLIATLLPAVEDDPAFAKDHDHVAHILDAPERIAFQDDEVGDTSRRNGANPASARNV